MSIKKEQDVNENNNKNKPITREELDKLIGDSQESGDWSQVENSDVSDIKGMNSLFYGVKGIKDLDLSKWDTSNVITMHSMFSSSDFNSPLCFNTSKVEDMSFMFFGSEYNHPLSLDTSKVKRFNSMFEESKFNHPLDFDTSNLKAMSYMFFNSKFNQLLNFSDTSNVVNMEFAFKGINFNQDISDWTIQYTKENEKMIWYLQDCLEKRKEKGEIQASIDKNSKSNTSDKRFHL